MAKKAKTIVEPMNLSLNMEATGLNIKRLVRNSGYTVKDIMLATGLTTEQAVYKWYRGDSIPSVEVALILCRLLNTKFEELIVINEEGHEWDIEKHKAAA